MSAKKKATKKKSGSTQARTRSGEFKKDDPKTAKQESKVGEPIKPLSEVPHFILRADDPSAVKLLNLYASMVKKEDPAIPARVGAAARDFAAYLAG